MSNLRIGKHIFETMVAITPSEQERGLMGASWPPPIMSFVYASPRYNAMWMKNTPSPLDIVFCLGGKIIDICHGEPHSTKIIGGNIPSDLVIELPFGTCEQNKIGIGQAVEMDYSPEVISKLQRFRY